MNLADKQGINKVITELKIYQSNLAHNKENMISRELVLKSQHALTLLFFYRKSDEEHNQSSCTIDESNVHTAYMLHLNDLKSEATNLQLLLNNSRSDFRQVYKFRNYVNILTYKLLCFSIALLMCYNYISIYIYILNYCFN